MNDFTAEEAAPLAKGLLNVGSCESDAQRFSRGEEERSTLNAQRSTSNRAQELLDRILYWTNGHPYLTQRLCRAVAEELGRDGEMGKRGNGEELAPTRRHADTPAREFIDRHCEELFLSLKARERDDNLIFVRERLLNSGADRASILDLYNQVRRGKKVPDDDTNPLISVFRLSGITRAENGYLQIRNRIYGRVFDRNWILSNLPDAELRRQRRAFRRGLVQATAVGTVALLVLMFLAVYQQPPRGEPHRLPDGSTLALDKTEYGKLHMHEPGRFQTLWFRNVLPKQFQPLLHGRGGIVIGTAEDSLFIWTKREGTNLPIRPAWRWVMFNEFGASLDAGVLMPSGSYWMKTPLSGEAGFRTTEINGWEIKAFPRRGHRIGVRLLERDPQDQNRWRQAAQFTIRNPTRSLYPVWSPEPLPNHKRAEDLDVKLLSFNSGIVDPGLQTTWRAAGQNENEVTGLKFEIGQGGKPAPWLPRLIELSDATGNRFAPHNWYVHPSDQPGTAFLYLASDLGANETWKARIEFTTARPTYSSNETWTISGVSMPRRGYLHQSSTNGVIDGATLQFLGVAGAETLLPGGAPLQHHAGPTIHVRLSTRVSDLRLQLVKAKANSGENLAPTQWMGSGDLYAWSFDLPSRTSSLDLTFAVYRSRTLDFLAMPSRLPREKTDSGKP